MKPSERVEIYYLATEYNMSYEALAEAYQISVEEVEQIVLSFEYRRG